MVSPGSGKALVITTLPVTVLLPRLQKVLINHLQDHLQDHHQDLKGMIRECLERISISRVFDIEGLWQALAELEESAADTTVSPVGQGNGSDSVSGDAGPERQVQQRTEIQDSEEEDGLSPPEPPLPQNPVTTPPDGRPRPEDPLPSTLPDLILITHTFTLLSALFSSRDKPAAHETALLLSSRLREIARSDAYGNPLIMLLNSTTSPFFPGHDDDDDDAPSRTTAGDEARQAKGPEPTLSSVFNPAPRAGYYHPPPGHARRRNKPSFGLVFAQMLDLHLLCTRVPRTREDAAAAEDGLGMGYVSYVWVVEVLLDEIGVYGESGSGEECGPRRCREQRWGAVDVDPVGGGRIVNAFGGTG